MRRRFAVQGTNEAFRCAHCGVLATPLENGSVRNHCPACLWSLHVDEFPGDRASGCGGPLEPIGLEHSGKKGWVIVHHCQRCGATRKNRAALDDPVMPDNFEVIVELSRHHT